MTGWKIDIVSDTEFAQQEAAAAFAGEGDGEGDSSGRCAALLSNGKRCPNAALPGSAYCGVPAHQALVGQEPAPVAVAAPEAEPEVAAEAEAAPGAEPADEEADEQVDPEVVELLQQEPAGVVEELEANGHSDIEATEHPEVEAIDPNRVRGTSGE